MGIISEAKHQMHLAKGSTIVHECRSSGLTVVDWCVDNNIWIWK